MCTLDGEIIVLRGKIKRRTSCARTFSNQNEIDQLRLKLNCARFPGPVERDEIHSLGRRRILLAPFNLPESPPTCRALLVLPYRRDIRPLTRSKFRVSNRKTLGFQLKSSVCTDARAKVFFLPYCNV